MSGPRPRYSKEAKARFFRTLQAYRESLKTGKDLVPMSLAIHASLASVPKHFKRYVSRAYRTGGES